MTTPLLVPAIAAALAPQASPEWRFHADGVLGTRLDLTVHADLAAPALRAADAVRTEILRLETLLSRHDASSELSRLNAAREMRVSDDLFVVLTRAAFWREASSGAFDERLGLASQLWRAGEFEAGREAANAARTASVTLDPATRTVTRDAHAVLDLDAIAKGYVIDRALAAARLAAPEITAALVMIGGDGAGWRNDANPWRIGLPEAGNTFDNAPIAAVVDFTNGAIATSGRGQRDVTIRNQRIGPAIGLNGQPAQAAITATARAPCAMDADALATIALTLPTPDALALADRMPDAALRIVNETGETFASQAWRESGPELIRTQVTAPTKTKAPAPPAAAPTAPLAGKFPVDWRVAIWYKLPERARRGVDFRAPYMAMWVTDAKGKPVRTLFMVGKNPDWQKDNFVWFQSYRARAKKVIDAVASSTAPTGRYAFMWEGRDEDEKRVPQGKYTLHIETSRERGGHSHRTMEIEIGEDRFVKDMPALTEDGGFTAVFAHYNDQWEPEN